MWDRKKVLEVYQEYKNSGYTIKQIGKKYNFSAAYHFKKHGLTKQKINKSRSGRKQLLWTGEKITNETEAYILGLLYADGSLRHNGFELTLIETDKEILEKISNILYGKVILNYRKSRNCGNNSKYKSKPQYRLIVTSHIMKNNLIMHGCIQAKTFKIRFPKLNNDMYKHFIRGYFDGDGCFSSSKKKKNIAKVTITSNIYFCDELTKFIENILNVNIKSKIRYGEIGDAVITNRNDIIIFMNWLYDNSTIYLARKSDKYHKFLNSIL